MDVSACACSGVDTLDPNSICVAPSDYSDQCQPEAYDSILQEYLGNKAYYLGPNGSPMISTFSSGGFTNDQWSGKCPKEVKGSSIHHC